MDTRVYVNGREICSKASDGVSTAAFPDPCWSPGPSVVPYPNTSSADALSNGTATVFIRNSMVAQEIVHSFLLVQEMSQQLMG
ncbi:hypothetical protein ACU42Y_09975 [Proteus mirabilis]